jgi:hypothetical protein
VQDFALLKEPLLVNGNQRATTGTNGFKINTEDISDYFDGSSDVPDRFPTGPANGWFQAVWERDFPVMQDLGINTLRLYNANPTTRQATVEQLGTNGITEAVGKNHIPFMDMAAQYGFKVIFPLVGDQTILTTSSEATVKQLLRNQIDEVGNHSALLVSSISNFRF